MDSLLWLTYSNVLKQINHHHIAKVSGIPDIFNGACDLTIKIHVQCSSIWSQDVHIHFHSFLNSIVNTGNQNSGHQLIVFLGTIDKSEYHHLRILNHWQIDHPVLPLTKSNWYNKSLTDNYRKYCPKTRILDQSHNRQYRLMIVSCTAV